MFRVIALSLIVAAGAGVGAILALVAGVAIMESGRSACEAAACADTFVRHFAPAGAVLGGLIGLGKALSIRAGRA
jgi:hypothetical protein